MSDVQRLIDESDIRNLALRYGSCVDKRDAEGLASLFTEDGTILGSGVEVRGHEQLKKIKDTLSRYDLTYHTVLNHLITLNGDMAEGEVYSHSHHVKKSPDGPASDLIMTITYVDRYVRRAGRWLFAHRTIDLKWTETTTVQAGARVRG